MSNENNDEGEQKKRSQAIDRGLEEDSKKLRRECKILLLGTHSIELEGHVKAVTDNRAQVPARVGRAQS